MTLPSAVLEEANRWLGAHEQPGGSNYVPGITDWWPMQGAWCACFVSRVFWNVGMPLGPYFEDDHAGYLWVSDGFDWMARGEGNSVGLVDPRDAQPGDPLGFEWGSTPGGMDHTGIVVANLGDCLSTIEGNTSDQVMCHIRYFSEIAACGRPRWAEPAPEPPEDEMASWEFYTHQIQQSQYMVFLTGGARQFKRQINNEAQATTVQGGALGPCVTYPADANYDVVLDTLPTIP